MKWLKAALANYISNIIDNHPRVIEIRGKTIDALDRIVDLERKNFLLTQQLKMMNEVKRDN